MGGMLYMKCDVLFDVRLVWCVVGVGMLELS